MYTRFVFIQGSTLVTELPAHKFNVASISTNWTVVKDYFCLEDDFGGRTLSSGKVSNAMYVPNSASVIWSHTN